MSPLNPHVGALAAHAKKYLLGAVFSCALWPAAPQAQTSTPQATVPAQGAGSKNALPPIKALAVDLERFQGTWYQIALYPNFFQRQCASDTTARYRPLPAETGLALEVFNSCRNEAGEMQQVLGAAKAVAPGQLKVRFAPDWLSWLPLVWADYWVIQLGPDYRYAVVSQPSREYLWVLSRTPRLLAADEALIRQQLQQQGFELARLKWERHASAPP